MAAALKTADGKFEIKQVERVEFSHTEMRSLKIAPAPIKPIPVMILAEILSSLPDPYEGTIVKIVEPRLMRMMVRRPADLFRYSRSKPITPPHSTETAIAITSLSFIVISTIITGYHF